jgi:hypothetical protein
MSLEDEAIDQKVKELKANHKLNEVHVVQVKGADNKEYVGYFRKPNFHQSCRIFSKVAKDDWGNAVEDWLMNCWLDGAPEIQEDDELKFALIPLMTNIVSMNVSFLKKK